MPPADGWRVVRTAALAFIVSRVLFFALVIAGSQIAFLGKAYSDSIWETRITLRGERVLPELERVSMVGDAWFYRAIAMNGYDRAADRASAAGQQPNWAFFPLFPLLTRALPFSFAFSGMLLSNVAFGIALVLLGAVAMQYGASADDAGRAIFYAAFFPTSYFFSLPLTEGLFLLLSLGSVLAAQKGWWSLAGLLGGLAAATRFPGILLLLPLAILFFAERRERPAWRALWMLLIPAGTGAFMLYLQRITGDPLAFARSQTSWGRSARGFWEPLLAYVSEPWNVGAPWNLLALNFAVAVLLLVVGIAFLVRRRWSLGAYTLASVLLPLSTGSLQSMARYGVVVFPVFLALAIAGRRANVERTILAVSVVLFGWLVAMLTLRLDFALA